MSLVLVTVLVYLGSALVGQALVGVVSDVRLHFWEGEPAGVRHLGGLRVCDQLRVNSLMLAQNQYLFVGPRSPYQAAVSPVAGHWLVFPFLARSGLTERLSSLSLP